MPRLKASNLAQTELATSINNITTTINVVDISVFPDVPFRLSVNNEIMEATAKGTSLTVLRAQEGTVATSHSAGDKIELRFTAGMYEELVDKVYVDSELANKVDNSRMLTDVPLGAKFTDTVYTHPANHPASIIAQETNYRFVSDTEKAAWNSKWNYNENTIKAVKVNSAINADTVNGKTVESNVPASAKFTDTITTVNGKTGAISKSDIVALGIPGQDTPSPTIATEEEAKEGTDNTKMMTPLTVRQAIDKRVPEILYWKDVQNIVRQGLASQYFAVGDQLISDYNSQPIVWDVIGINHDTPTDVNLTNSMTIQSRDCLQNAQFDAIEPSNPDANSQEYGNNRYIHSGIKQWLNSNQASFIWESQHQYDAISSITGPGFLKLLDPELVAVIGEVSKQVTRANVDGGGQDLFSDKVFLLSRVEAGLGTEGETTGEVVYPFYSGAANPARIKLLSGSPRYWWLRSPLVGYSSYTRIVNTDGSLHYYTAYRALGLSPACVII